jgi:23S rRNA (adenine2503-C2)-methyltransferase
VPKVSEIPQSISTETDASASSFIDLTGLDADDLTKVITDLGLPSFRAKQIWRWVWRHGITRFDDMTDLGKPVR